MKTRAAVAFEAQKPLEIVGIGPEVGAYVTNGKVDF
jgi:hypothetical protein